MPKRLLAATLLAVLIAACSERPVQGLGAEAVTANNRGVGLMGRFDYAAASEVFAGLLQAHPGDATLRFNLAVALMNRQQEGDEARALALFEALAAERPDDPAVAYDVGLLQLRAGRAGEAAAKLRQVCAADPGDAHAAYFLGQALETSGDAAGALEQYRRAVALDPYLRSGYYAAFMLLRRQGERAQAAELAERFQALAGNPQARLVEFKYTRMGPKSEARMLDSADDRPAPLPAGPLFLPPQRVASAAAPGGTGISIADVDGDGHLDLLLSGRESRLLKGNADGGFDPAAGHPLAGLPAVRAVLWGDLDNDGLPDAYLLRRGPNQLWRQRAPGQWQRLAVASGGEADTVDGALVDADHDGDLDIFLVNGDGGDELFNNNLDGTFRPLAQEYGLAGDGHSRQVLALDLEGDRDTDLLVLGRTRHRAHVNELLWRYRPAPGLDALLAAPVEAAVAADVDVDGRAELYTWDAGAGVRRWSPRHGVWSAQALGRPDGVAAGPQGTRMAMADIDGDGRPELILSHGEGWGVYALEAGGLRLLQQAASPGLQQWTLLQQDPARGPAIVGLLDSGDLIQWRPGPGRFGFLALSFSGLQKGADQMRSNASGIGTVGALRVDSRWSAVRALRGDSGPGQDLQPLAIGLGGRPRADFLALTWSDGVLQTELALEGGRLHRIEEQQRQLASCPVLFGWDGRRYAFVSDLLGVGGIGFAVAPGEYAEPRPWERFLLPPGLAADAQGRYRLKITEPMEEAAYVDAARLVAYDLPPGWDMVLDERMGILGPAPSGRPLFYDGVVPVRRAVDGTGRDVTAELAGPDRKAAPPGPPDRRFIGMLERDHELTLELAEPVDPRRGEPVLVADGWVEYPYSQTSFSAWQAGAAYRAPSLEARLADGRWQRLREQFGYPAGMPRRMALPLPELPAGVTALRLRGNMEVYWDRIALVYARPSPEVRRRNLDLAAASVRPMGFPLRSTGGQRQPHYDYDRRAPLWDTRHMAGHYTEFGPAEALVASRDDAVAIIGPGEEVHLEFAAPAAPPPAGWQRRLVLEADGWAKDMDLYTRDGATVGPLPGRPSPARDALHARFNTRYADGY
jgi:Flp pilus assembly protein TadD